MGGYKGLLVALLTLGEGECHIKAVLVEVNALDGLPPIGVESNA